MCRCGASSSLSSRSISTKKTYPTLDHLAKTSAQVPAARGAHSNLPDRLVARATPCLFGNNHSNNETMLNVTENPEDMETSQLVGFEYC